MNLYFANDCLESVATLWSNYPKTRYLIHSWFVNLVLTQNKNKYAMSIQFLISIKSKNSKVFHSITFFL